MKMTNVHRLLILSLPQALLTACASMAPVLEMPALPVQAQFVAATQTTTDNPSPIGWKQFFSDAQMLQCITAALSNNRDLRMAALRIEESRALYQIQSADLLPSLNATAGVNRSLTPASLSVTGNRALVSANQVGLSAPNFELDFFGRVKNLSEAALNAYLSTKEARAAAQTALIAEVAKNMLSLRSWQEQIDVALQTLDNRQSSHQLLLKKFDQGAASEIDVKLSEAARLNAVYALSVLKRQYAATLNNLAVLTGLPADQIKAENSLSSQESILQPLKANLSSELLASRPDIRSAELRLKAANANIGAARAAFYPHITLTTNLGTASNQLSGLFNAGSNAWVFSPQISLPIFDAGRNQANLDLAQVRKNMAVADYEKTIQIAFREVSDALTARPELDQQIQAQQQLVATQQQRLHLAQLRFDHGIASQLEVYDAQRDLLTAQLTASQTQLARLTNAVDLFRALGGGEN
jgi:multidrug efflux system outer membrane protein